MSRFPYRAVTLVSRGNSMRLRSFLRIFAVCGLLASLFATATPGSAAGTSTIQTGVVTFSQANATTWYPVTFDESFDVVPVVVMGPISFNGSHPAVMRVRNVTTTGFEYQLDEWDYLDAGHTGETVSWVAATPGQHDLRKMTAFATTVVLDHQWQTVSLAGFDAPPVVFGSVGSDNDPSAAAIRMRNVTATSVQLRIQEEEAYDKVGQPRDAAETVQVMAFSEGSTTEDGLALVVGKTTDSVTHSWHTVNTRSRGVTGVLADMQTFDGGDTAGIRYRNLGDTGVDVRVEEEKSQNSETSHTTEVVGWMLITSW
ncbi:MAG: H-type lectin domain-containing protein [Actinomycetota bacterium]